MVSAGPVNSRDADTPVRQWLATAAAAAAAAATPRYPAAIRELRRLGTVAPNPRCESWNSDGEQIAAVMVAITCIADEHGSFNHGAHM